jgi:hypothetical protein
LAASGILAGSIKRIMNIRVNETEINIHASALSVEIMDLQGS